MNLKIKLETNMKKSLAIFLSVVGLVLVTTNPAFAQGDNLHLRSGIATRTFNNRTGPADLLNSSVSSDYLAFAANNNVRGNTTATLNTSLAILAGVLTLMLLQRRNRVNIDLKPRH